MGHDVALDIDPGRDLEQFEPLAPHAEHRALGDEDGAPTLRARKGAIVADLLDLLDELAAAAFLEDGEAAVIAADLEPPAAKVPLNTTFRAF